MASVHFSVQGSDETFSLQVDPPPAIGSRFSVGERLLEVVTLEQDAGPGSADVSATVREVDGDDSDSA